MLSREHGRFHCVRLDSLDVRRRGGGPQKTTEQLGGDFQLATGDNARNMVPEDDDPWPLSSQTK